MMEFFHFETLSWKDLMDVAVNITFLYFKRSYALVPSCSMIFKFGIFLTDLIIFVLEFLSEMIIEFFNFIFTKKLLNNFLEKLKLEDSLIISDKDSKMKIIKSARNIKNLKIIEQEGTNAYDLLKYKNVIFTASSIKSFQDRVSE